MPTRHNITTVVVTLICVLMQGHSGHRNGERAVVPGARERPRHFRGGRLPAVPSRVVRPRPRHVRATETGGPGEAHLGAGRHGR